MPGGFSVTSGGKEFEVKITPIVIVSCMLDANGGLMFGHDIGILGGVTSMADFLKKFFPVIYKRQQVPGLESNYCKYDNQYLQLFTSSLYLAALTTTFFASYTTRKLVRKMTMLVAGGFFCDGTILNDAAVNLGMLIVGRLYLVVELASAVPPFLSEVAPSRIRGALKILFQLNVTVGLLCANIINFESSEVTGGRGWRLSLGLAGIPSVFLTVGAIIVVDTPNSLIQRGKLEQGKAVLKKIRGVQNVEPEFLEILEASRAAKEVKHPFRNLLKRRNRLKCRLKSERRLDLRPVFSD